MSGWHDVCALDDLTPNRGVAALLGGRQVALFLIGGSAGAEVLAIGNVDPCSGAAVLSRGIVGSAGDALVVASPVHKQRFDLRTGACLDDPGHAAGAYPTRVRDGRVEVHLG